MSPRSEEFIAEARERLRVARAAVETGAFSAAVSLAYYAMLNAAARGAQRGGPLLEAHSGAWHLVRETFVKTRRFDESLASRAGKTQELRLGADYEAQHVEPADAEDAVALAEEFVAAIETLCAD